MDSRHANTNKTGHIIVNHGDTLYSIARQYGIDVNDILELNPQIYNTRYLSPGHEIRIPIQNHHNRTEPETAHHGNSQPRFKLEPGYKIETVVKGFTYPTSIALDDQGNVFIGESGFSYGPAKVQGGGKIKRVEPSGRVTTIASGFEGPLTGLTWHKGSFYVATGSHPGKIHRVSNGTRKVLVDGLPTGGDHYTSNIVFDSHDNMYFGNGTFTNSAVVGIDNFGMGWLGSHPDWHDIAPRDYTLRGVNYQSLNPFNLENPEYVITGAFHPFGTPSYPGEIVEGHLKANGVIYRANMDGSGLEQYASGLRNPYALKISPQGRLICIDQGYDARGSRPVANAPDLMYDIQGGGWYGWPDYVAYLPVSDPRFKPENADTPELVLADHPQISGTLIATFEPHAAAMQFDFSHNPQFGYVGEVFVSLFGALSPMTGTVHNHPGHRVVRVNLNTGKVTDFLTPINGHQDGHGNGHPPIRPIDVKFSRDGKTLYMLDFGTLQVSESAMTPWAESGVLYKITRL